MYSRDTNAGMWKWPYTETDRTHGTTPESVDSECSAILFAIGLAQRMHQIKAQCNSGAVE